MIDVCRKHQDCVVTYYLNAEPDQGCPECAFVKRYKIRLGMEQDILRAQRDEIRKLKNELKRIGGI